jgi:NTP pyrophosphatase (non-canonical NTP hydrolase)
MDKVKYFIYHIPGKKIGVTRNLKSRVVEQQGYNLDEIEVLDQSNDINYISNRELELQQSYGYKVDRYKYKDLLINESFNRKTKKPKLMNINATEQTSTFPVPLNKLKGRLMDEIGTTWQTSHGTFEINMDSIKWIMDNAKTSMYNANRTYVYNKAFAKYFKPKAVETAKDVYQAYYDVLSKRKTEYTSFQDIRDWAEERGIFKKGDTKTQYVKLMEEAGELGKAILNEDQPEVIDAIGDMVVVLTNLAHLSGLKIERCIDSAYEVISKRTGKMVNGTFVKDAK